MQTSLNRADRLAALREDIRRAGDETRELRVHTWSALWLGALGLLTSAMGAVFLFSPGTADRIPLMAAVSFTWLGTTAVLMGGVVPLLALGHRAGHRGRLGRLLKRLPREEQWGVLLPLRDHPAGDTRKIVRPLLRDLGVPMELAPVSAPLGTGAELSAAPPTELTR